MSKSPVKRASIDDAVQPSNHDVLIAAASQVVSAYIMNRPQEQFDLPAMLSDVYGTLSGLAQAERAPLATRRPNVAVEDSVQDDYLICLEDGKQVKMLKRYLKSAYNMTPDDYRARWDLPATYPMVAPNYAVVRSKLAKEIGLGRRGMPAVAKQFQERRASAR